MAAAGAVDLVCRAFAGIDRDAFIGVFVEDVAFVAEAARGTDFYAVLWFGALAG